MRKSAIRKNGQSNTTLTRWRRRDDLGRRSPIAVASLGGSGSSSSTSAAPPPPHLPLDVHFPAESARGPVAVPQRALPVRGDVDIERELPRRASLARRAQPSHVPPGRVLPEGDLLLEEQVAHGRVVAVAEQGSARGIRDRGRRRRGRRGWSRRHRCRRRRRRRRLGGTHLSLDELGSERGLGTRDRRRRSGSSTSGLRSRGSGACCFC